ncbi:hypothetical protein [Pseudonocardia dioxanivorans]|uniref:hypothetical protein n=1 Tax=Pseudonocardia dioxanivorans TaxID=240495 RepID=UPI0002E10F6C|nr:hypothetical protein [Pseudonocardia dioxanivorans]
MDRPLRRRRARSTSVEEDLALIRAGGGFADLRRGRPVDPGCSPSPSRPRADP